MIRKRTFLAAGIIALAVSVAAEAQERPVLVDYLAQELSAAAVGAKQGAQRTLKAIRSDPLVLSLRLGRAAPAPVVQARALSLVLPDTGETVSFDDLAVEVLESGYGMYSRAPQSGTSITLVVMGDDVVGTLRHRGAVYEVRALGGGLTAVYLYDTTQLRLHPEGDTITPNIAPEGSSSRVRSGPTPAAGKDRRDEIDTLVVYTTRAKSEAGNIAALIALSILDTNVHYANSEVTTRLRLVHSYETTFQELADLRENLVRLQRPEDGFLDDVHEKRDQFGADVVMLMVTRQGDWCGWAYYLWNDPRGEAWAFAVVRQNCAVAYHVFAHEVGHLQGAKHNPEQRALDEESTEWDIRPYVHGLCNAETDWRTVMSYNTGQVCNSSIPYFSNPEVLYRSTPTGDVELRNNAAVINETAHVVANFRQRRDGPVEHTHRLPLVPGGDDGGRQGFVRVYNRSEVDGDVVIYAVDDAGERFGPVTLELAAGHTGAFNSNDIESGNAGQGLRDGIGDGTGSWRLELVTALDIEARAYIRTTEGFVTSMHLLAREHENIARRYVVPFFNPASNTSIRSWLRVANPNPTTAYVTLEAWDSRGQSGEEAVEFSLRAGAAVTISSQQLEAGDEEVFTGRLGEGTGKWRLEVSAEHPLEVMSLLSTRSGHLTNVSR